jgi:hypothetical protein
VQIMSFYPQGVFHQPCRMYRFDARIHHTRDVLSPITHF